MKRICILVLVLAAGAASAQYREDCRNGIGLFTVDPVSPASISEYSRYDGAPGTFTVYGIIFNPHDDNTDQDLASIGGYELRLVVPADVFILEATLPDGATRAAGAYDDFLVTMDAPVVFNQCLLFTLTLGAFTGNPGYLYLAPPSAGASLTGQMAVVGTGPDAQPSGAFPVSGDFGYPVFSMWDFVPILKSSWTWNCDTSVPTRDTSFGALKALYR